MKTCLPGLDSHHIIISSYILARVRWTPDLDRLRLTKCWRQPPHDCGNCDCGHILIIQKKTPSPMIRWGQWGHILIIFWFHLKGGYRKFFYSFISPVGHNIWWENSRNGPFGPKNANLAFFGPWVKTALRPPPSALAEN